jgi:hypothetical protein
VKKIIYGTLVLFLGILVAVIIVASRHPVQMVKYENGVVVAVDGE